jgi:putative NADPH-quinone reductase
VSYPFKEQTLCPGALRSSRAIDPSGQRFGHALAEAYAQGAKEAGHEVRLIEVTKINFPLLRSQEEWKSGTLLGSLQEAQDAIGWAEHLVFFP